MDYTLLTLKSKIKPRVVHLVIVVVCGLIALGSLVGVIAVGKDDPSKAVPFTSTEDRGTYVYLDIAQLDDEYVVTDDTFYWYSAVDANGYYYMVKMRESDLKNFKTQIANYEPDIIGETARVYGTAVYDTDVIDIYADVYGTTSDEIIYYFGYNYIDTTFTKSSDHRWTFIVFAIVAAALGGFYAYKYLQADKACAKMINSIMESGEADSVAQDITNSGPVKGNNYVLAESCLITAQTATPYKDIVWVYPHTFTYNYIIEVHSVVVKDRYGNEVVIGFKRKDEVMDKLLNDLYEKNNDIVFGYNYENQKNYNAMMKEAKNA